MISQCHFNLEIKPIKTLNKFSVIDDNPNYFILLARPWLHKNNCICSMLHQCVKTTFKGKSIELFIIKAPFNEDNAHIIIKTRD